MITPQQALAQAWNGVPNPNPTDQNESSWNAAAVSYILSASYDADNTQSQCTSLGISPAATDLSLTQAAGKLASTGIAAGSAIFAASSGSTIASVAAAPLTLGISFGIAAVVGIVSAIFSHHAQAVARVNSAWCQLIPAVNNSFAVIQEGIANGSISPSAAVAGLDQIHTEFVSAVNSTGTYSTSPYCNALCEAEVVIYAIVLYWQGQYNAMAQQQAAAGPVGTAAASAAAAVDSAAASTGLPSWAVWLLGGFVLYELVS